MRPGGVIFRFRISVCANLVAPSPECVYILEIIVLLVELLLCCCEDVLELAFVITEKEKKINTPHYHKLDG